MYCFFLQVSLIGTPKNTVPTPDSKATNSPILRKTTVEGHNAKVMFTGVVDEPGEKVSWFEM